MLIISRFFFFDNLISIRMISSFIYSLLSLGIGVFSFLGGYSLCQVAANFPLVWNIGLALFMCEVFVFKYAVWYSYLIHLTVFFASAIFPEKTGLLKHWFHYKYFEKFQVESGCFVPNFLELMSYIEIGFLKQKCETFIRK